MPPDAPAALPDDPEQELLTKIHWLCARIVRGQHARDLFAVKWHRFQMIVTVILSALSGAGILVVQQVKQPPDGALITGGAMVALLSGALAGLYQAFGIEKKALLALACHETFKRLHAQLDGAVGRTDPVPEVLDVYEAVQQHLQGYAEVITLRKGWEAEVEDMYQAMLKDRPKWVLSRVVQAARPGGRKK